ncbi:MAG: coenzyme F420-0:L-glutamate ligase [Thermoproteota archaeon]|nr:coenzyme F420-0:L-glutamate ligase [Thermoproteota archaeon]
MPSIQIIPVKGLPLIKEGDDIAEMICDAAEKQETPVKNRDIIIVAHKIVSRAEGKTTNLDDVTPSEFAKHFAQQFHKDPALIETVLQQSKSIIRMGNGKLITETEHGLVCANSGVDHSNVPGEQNVALLPDNSDQSARKIRKKIKKLTGKDVAVVISDTHGRPLRRGEVNIALGTAGIRPILDYRGKKDLFEYVLKVKHIAVADELASAAELVIGQAD